MMFFRTASAALTAIGICMGLSACAPQPLDTRASLAVPYEEMQAQYVFQSGSAILSRSQRSGLAEFLQKAALGPTDAVFVTIPMTGIAQVDNQRVRTVETLLSRTPGRISLSRKTDRIANPNVGLVRVVRGHGTAQVNCTAGAEALGCANRQNLATMLYQPSDAITPARIGGRAIQ